MDDHIMVSGLSEMAWRVGTVIATPNAADQIPQAARTMDRSRRAQKLEEISQTIRRNSMDLFVLRSWFLYLYTDTGESVLPNLNRGGGL